MGACLDLVTDENGKADIDMLSQTLDSTLQNTDLVIEMVKAGGYAAKIPMFTAFGIGLYALNKYTSRKKFHRKGEEHGSARWANKKDIQSLADKPKRVRLPFKVKVHNFFERLKFWKHFREEKVFIKDNNVVLTNEVKMSLNTRQTRKNLNVMVIGGSGSGKSRFYVKPNLMQANTSYVCTDPKGELLRSTGKMLERYGYDIRVFNLIDMAHSNNYKVTLRNCVSTKGNKYAAVFALDDSGKYVNLKFVEYVKTRRRKPKQE